MGSISGITQEESARFDAGVNEVISISNMKVEWSAILPSICNGTFTDFEYAWGRIRTIVDSSRPFVELKLKSPQKPLTLVPAWDGLKRRLDELSTKIQVFRENEFPRNSVDSMYRADSLTAVVRIFNEINEDLNTVMFDSGISMRKVREQKVQHDDAEAEI